MTTPTLKTHDTRACNVDWDFKTSGVPQEPTELPVALEA